MRVIATPVISPRVAAALAAAGAALAAWLSCGTIAFRGSHAARFGVLPLDASSLVLAGIAGVVVLALALRNDRGIGVAIAVSPLALLLLPWLPIAVPPAFLVWTGALASLVWLSVAVGLMAGDERVRRIPAFTSTGRAVACAAGLAGLLFSLAAWSASASVPGGDEPHYLVITQSLLVDHDLQIENNHARGDYRAYFPGDLAPDYRVQGRNGAIYSIHAPGVPVLVLPAFALGGYHGAVAFLILLSASACALAWWLAWRTTGSLSAAWFGWAAVTLSAPLVLASFTVYPDVPGAAAVLTGFWAMRRAEWEGDAADRTPDADRPSLPRGWRSWGPWLLHGTALAALPWMHTRFALLAVTLGGLVLVRIARTPNPLVKVVAFLSVPVASALAWLGFFLVVYGAPDPIAPYGGIRDSSIAFLPDGLGGLMFDQGFGLLATAPVLAVALAGLVRARRLAFEWLVMATPYALAVGAYAMWWAGWSAPARFLVPLVLPLAIPAACAWRDSSRGLRATMIAALVVSAWLSAVMVAGGGGLLGYHGRNTAGLTPGPWLEWASSVLDLPAGAPAFVPLPAGTGLSARVRAAHAGFAATVPWVICLSVAAMLVRWMARPQRRRPETLVAGTVLLFASAVMVAVSVVWNMHAAHPLTVLSAQMSALRRLAAGRSVVFDFAAWRRISASEAWHLRLEVPVSRDDRSPGPPGAGAIVTFPWVPAGSYVIAARRHGGAGDMTIAVDAGDDRFPIVSRPIAAFDAGEAVYLPVGVRVLTVRLDAGARDQVDAIELRPLARAPGPVPAGAARHAARYGHTVVFFLDDRTSPEPTGFWAWGGRESSVVLAADDRPTMRTVVLRNGAVDNAVTIESGGWRQDLQLHPGEERGVDIPLDPSRGSALVRIRSSTGFRPSDVDPNSRDTRFLGVFVRMPANAVPSVRSLAWYERH